MMNRGGHGDKLPRLQERAVSALLTSGTIKAAAEKSGISYRTLKSWLTLPDFQQAMAAARRRCLEASLGQISRLTRQAAAALCKALKCGDTAQEVKAALAIFRTALDGAKAIDVQARLDELEARLNATSGPRRTTRAG